MSASALISEINALSQEIKRRASGLRDLRKRKKLLETKLINFLNKNNQRGVTFKGQLAVMKETKTRSIKRLKKGEKAMLASEMLQKYGIQNPGQLANDLVELMTGPQETITTLKYRKL